MQSEQINELAAALAAAQGEFSTVKKDSENPFFKSKYADLSAVVKTAAPVLAVHKLAVSQFISTTVDGEGNLVDTLTTWLIHQSGQYINDTMRLRLTKEDAQGQGSAITYARRYSYMAVLGLVADEDDDGNKASTPKATTPYRAATKAPVQAVIPVDDEHGAMDDDVVAKLGTAIKLKGITDKVEIIKVLNHHAKKRYDVPNFMKLNEAQGKELTTWVGLQTKADLLEIEPF